MNRIPIGTQAILVLLVITAIMVLPSVFLALGTSHDTLSSFYTESGAHADDHDPCSTGQTFQCLQQSQQANFQRFTRLCNAAGGFIQGRSCVRLELQCETAPSWSGVGQYCRWRTVYIVR